MGKRVKGFLSRLRIFNQVMSFFEPRVCDLVSGMHMERISQIEGLAEHRSLAENVVAIAAKKECV